MKSTYLSLASATLLAMTFALGCDPESDSYIAAPTDEALDAQFAADDETEFDAADEQSDETEELEGLDVLGVEKPEPSAAYADCVGASFCFWTQAGYKGNPYIQPKGDFAVSFPQAIRSARKHQGTYRVKMFSSSNFTGQCAVFGCEGCAAASPQLLFPVRSARRMEPWEPGC